MMMRHFYLLTPLDRASPFGARAFLMSAPRRSRELAAFWADFPSAVKFSRSTSQPCFCLSNLLSPPTPRPDIYYCCPFSRQRAPLPLFSSIPSYTVFRGVPGKSAAPGPAFPGVIQLAGLSGPSLVATSPSCAFRLYSLKRIAQVNTLTQAATCPLVFLRLARFSSGGKFRFGQPFPPFRETFSDCLMMSMPRNFFPATG